MKNIFALHVIEFMVALYRREKNSNTHKRLSPAPSEP